MPANVMQPMMNGRPAAQLPGPRPGPAVQMPRSSNTPVAHPQAMPAQMPGQMPMPGMVPGKGPVSQAVNQRIQQRSVAPGPGAVANGGSATPLTTPGQTPRSPMPSATSMAGSSTPTTGNPKSASYRRVMAAAIVAQFGREKCASYLAETAIINLVPRLFSKQSMLRYVKKASDKRGAMLKLAKILRAFEKAASRFDVEDGEDTLPTAALRGAGLGAGIGAAVGGATGVRGLSRSKITDPKLMDTLQKSRGPQGHLDLAKLLSEKSKLRSPVQLEKAYPKGSAKRLAEVIRQMGPKNVIKHLGKRGLAAGGIGAALGGGAAAVMKSQEA